MRIRFAAETTMDLQLFPEVPEAISKGFQTAKKTCAFLSLMLLVVFSATPNMKQRVIMVSNINI